MGHDIHYFQAELEEDMMVGQCTSIPRDNSSPVVGAQSEDGFMNKLNCRADTFPVGNGGDLVVIAG